MEVDYVRVYQIATTTSTDGYEKKISNPYYSESEFVVSPNPFNDQVKISYSGCIDQINIYNCIGQKIMNTEYNLPYSCPLIVLNLENLEPGIYFLGFLYHNNLRGISKTVKYD